MWICPACKQALQKQSSQWTCINQHSYDMAKEGYVNLMLANQKRSKEPGDNKQMINARREFLATGSYQPLSDRIAVLLNQNINNDTPFLLDAGCGEGYYLDHVTARLQAEGKTPESFGSDISKVAIQKAAKKYAQHHFSVASSFNLPVSDNSIDGVIQVFAPVSGQEIGRILKPGGIWIQVNPAPEHLCQIKQAIYTTPEPYSVSPMPENARVVHSERLRFDVSLESKVAREQLLMMTPFYWSVEKGQLAAVIDKMSELSADFDIRLLSMDSSDE